MDQIKQIESSFNKAVAKNITIIEDIIEFDNIGDSSFEKAEMLDAQNMPELALKHLNIALHAYEKEKEIVLDTKYNPYDIENSFFNVYDLSLCLGAAEIAKTCCHNMITLYEIFIENSDDNNKYKEELATRHEWLADLYLDEENIEQAKHHVQKSIDILTLLSQDYEYFDNTILANILTSMGTILHDFDHNLPEAIKLYEQAKEIFEKEIILNPENLDDMDHFHIELKTLLEYYNEVHDDDNIQKIESRIKEIEPILSDLYKKYFPNSSTLNQYQDNKNN